MSGRGGGAGRRRARAATHSRDRAARRGPRQRVAGLIAPAPRSSGGPRRGSARAPSPSSRRAAPGARRAARSIRRRRGCGPASRRWLEPIWRSCIESRSLASRSAASRSAAAAPFESSRRRISPAWRMRDDAPFSSDSAFSIPGIPPSLRAASPATSSVRLPIAACRSAWARAASRSCGVIISDARGCSFARSSAISWASARASRDRVRALVAVGLGRRLARPPRLGDLVQVLGGAFQAALRALRLGLGLTEVALAEQPAHLPGAVAGAFQLLRQRPLAPRRDARQPLLQPLDLLDLLLDELVDLAAHAALHLGLLPVRGGLRLLVQRALVALDVADLLHQIGDDAVLLREALGAEAVGVLIEHLAQAARGRCPARRAPSPGRRRCPSPASRRACAPARRRS